MPAASGARGCSVLAHEAAKGRHRKTEELTVRLLEVVAAFGTSSRRGVDGGGALEREREGG